MRAHVCTREVDWFQPVTSGHPWSDRVYSDPISDVDRAVAAYVAKTERWPKVLEVDLEAHQALQHHPLILDRIRLTGAVRPGPKMLSHVFDVDEYHIAGVHPDPRTRHARERAMDDVAIRARLIHRRVVEAARRLNPPPFSPLPDDLLLGAGLTEGELATLRDHWREFFDHGGRDVTPLPPVLADLDRLFAERVDA